MATVDPDRCDLVREQARMFRLLERDHDLTRAKLAIETGIPAPTLKSYATGTEMPGSALRKFARLAKDEPAILPLVSLLLSGTETHFALDEGGEGDPDRLGREGLGVAAAVNAARDPNGPGGTNIVPMERAAIADAARRLCGTARAVAA